MVRPIFVTGIDTGIGKTIVSATVVQALGADYWKPVQAGDLEHSDTMRVRSLVTCPDVTFHPERFNLKHPMSPHAAAELDGVAIHLEDFAPPTRQKLLVVEGAGGCLFR
jgi:dethiobiotin synthetase